MPFEVIDAHQHFWEPATNDQPWLRVEPPIPFRYGDYRSLKRAYLPRHYRADASTVRVVGSVYVEAEWARGLAVAELAYVEGLRRLHGLPTVAIAQAWLDADDIAAQIDALMPFEFVRGVRHKPHANPTPAATSPGGMTSPDWRRGFARLRPAGLRFELQTPWWHMRDAARLASDFADTQIIVNHTGLPADRSRDGIDAWSEAMREVARCDNVAVKISGLGLHGGRWDAESNREIVLRTIDMFGVDRCMFASNFPVDGLCATFDEIYRGFRCWVATLAPVEQSALFVDNARRIYDIGTP